MWSNKKYRKHQDFRPSFNNLYYHCLASNNRQVPAIINGAWESFEPIRDYLDKSLEAEKEREIGSLFEVIHDKKRLHLKKQSSKLEILSHGSIGFQFDLEWCEIINSSDFDIIPKNKKLNYKDQETYHEIDDENHFVYGKGDERQIFIKFPKEPNKNETIEWNKQEIIFKKIIEDPKNLTINQGDEEINISNVNFNEEDNSFDIFFEGNIDENETLYVNNFPINNYHISQKIAELDKIISVKKEYNGSAQENQVNYLSYDHDNNKVIIPKVSHEKLILYNKDGTVLPYRFCSDEDLKFITVNGRDFEIYRQSTEEKSYLCTNDVFPANNSTAIGNDGQHYLCRIKIREEQELRIRLIDEEEEKGDVSDRSPIDYFFDDDVNDLLGEPKYHDAFQNGLVFPIKKKDTEKMIITIKTNNRNYSALKKLEALARRKNKIYLHRNLYQLKMQKWAIKQLIESPLPEHKNIIRLSENSDKIRWDSVNSKDDVDEKDWVILNNPKFEDLETQREFVRIALNTPDFAFLEGPPGSGKTTTILELIYQLIKRNKKILLTGSTHVAIDNVLERLKEKKIYMDKILPIRIGDPFKISKNIVEFQIDNVIPKNDEFEDLILNASNLVCGTMIGILKHPLFQETLSKNRKKKRVIPLYDYLIIDESSKTTFQEFIIPALFAKKWILVGDINQLSPYTESSYLKKYLEKIKDNSLKKFSPNSQLACYFLYLLLNYYLDFRHIRRNYKLPKKFRPKFCCPVNSRIIQVLIQEIPERYNSLVEADKNKFPLIGIVSKLISKNHRTDSFFIIKIDDILNNEPASVLLNSCDLIFIDSEELKKHNILKEKIPANFLVVNQLNWEKEQQHYRLNFFYEKRKKFNFDIINKEIKIINDDVREKNWANEISWRLIRLYELRNVSGHRKNYEDHLEYLIPKSINLSNSMENATSIALPSILESLQVGIQQKFRTNIKSVLKTGFPRSDFTVRHKKLLYQFRMHSDISEFSRKEFYTDNNGISALRDSSAIDRVKKWTYQRYNNKSYKSRAVWIDVNGMQQGNKNPKEVMRLMTELKAFVNWANSTQNTKKIWEVACLTYYRGQERLIRDKLRVYSKQFNRFSHFKKGKVRIILHTVDKIQGQEADVVILSLVRTSSTKWGGNFGFMDNPNRLNVALTRAKYQLIIIGQLHNFKNQNSSINFKNLTETISVES